MIWTGWHTDEKDCNAGLFTGIVHDFILYRIHFAIKYRNPRD